MLPNVSKHPVSAGGNQNNNHTANSCSDRHSMVSGTTPFVQEPSDIEGVLSMGGGPPSEAGSIFDTTLNNAAAADDRRDLELAYKDLYNEIHGKAGRKSSMPPASLPVVITEPGA